MPIRSFRRPFPASLAAFAVLAFSATGAMAQPVQWTAASGGNDRFYEVVPVSQQHITWEAARTAASLRSFGGLFGQLVTPGTATEESFVRTLAASSPNAFSANGFGWSGPWIGGFQPAGSSEPDGGWSWISGETWGYTNWLANEPNNGGGTSEYAVQLFSRSVIEASAIGWNDLAGDETSVFNVNSYIVEYSVIPSPSAAALLGLGGLLAAGGRRRR